MINKKISTIYGNSITIEKIKEEQPFFNLSHLNDKFYVMDQNEYRVCEYLKDGCVLFGKGDYVVLENDHDHFEPDDRDILIDKIESIINNTDDFHDQLYDIQKLIDEYKYPHRKESLNEND